MILRAASVSWWLMDTTFGFMVRSSCVPVATRTRSCTSGRNMILWQVDQHQRRFCFVCLDLHFCLDLVIICLL